MLKIIMYNGNWRNPESNEFCNRKEVLDYQVLLSY